MEHFNDSLKVPFLDATTKKFNPSTPKSKLSRHLPCITSRCRKNLGFSLRGLLLVKTKKSSSGMKLLIFLRESGHAPPENFEILEV